MAADVGDRQRTVRCHRQLAYGEQRADAGGVDEGEVGEVKYEAPRARSDRSEQRDAESRRGGEVKLPDNRVHAGRTAWLLLLDFEAHGHPSRRSTGQFERETDRRGPHPCQLRIETLYDES